MSQAFPGAAKHLLDGASVALGPIGRSVRPVHGAIAVSAAAALAIAGSQLLDHRGVSVATAAYSDVEAVAPAPELDHLRAGAGHPWAAYPIAIAALVVTAVAARGRWRVARLLVPLGLAVVAISLAVDAPRGLDEGGPASAYEGAEAILLNGFWAQLFAGAALACCGPLLAAHARSTGARARREATA